MKKTSFWFTIVFTMAMLLSTNIWGQSVLDLPAKSPKAQVGQVVGTSQVTVTYSRPGVYGRTIWGELVPYGKVWRTGANEATTIEFNTAVKLGGKDFEAGTYALFTIPAEDEWVVIINNNPNQWGDYSYKEEENVATFTAQAKAAKKFHERFTFYIYPTGETTAEVKLAWADKAVTFPVESAAEVTNEENIRVSPRSMVMQRVGLADVSIWYGSPGVKNRTIWGSLVPYDKVWRAGANEATTIEFDKNVMIEGEEVPAGKYALFMYPGTDEWTVILNSDAGQWGAGNYDESKNVFSFQTNPVTSTFHERLTYDFDDIDMGKATAFLRWDEIAIPMEIEVDYEEQAHSSIMKSFEMEEANPTEMGWMKYSMAGYYAADQDMFMDEAQAWVDVSMEKTESFWAYQVAAKVYHKLGKNEKAMEFIKKAWENGENDPFFNEEMKSQLKELEASIKADM